MKFDIITIFPEIFSSYFGESILKRAKKSSIIDIETHNLREYTQDKHNTVDDIPYGGGAGMVMKVEPIYRAIEYIRKQDIKVRTILFSAKGKRYTQEDAKRLSKYDQLIMICGRYEGVDERVAEHVIDEEVSIGDYVLTGGEIPAMIIVDSVSRMIPGVLGNKQSLEGESYSNDNIKGTHPQYTRPESFQGWKVPEVLLSGNHAEIEKWRKQNQLTISNKD